MEPGLEFLERQSVVLSGWDIANGDSGGGCLEALDSPGYPCRLRVLELLSDIVIIQVNFDANPFTAETFAKLLSLLMELEHYASGGLTPADVLRTATTVSAEALGAGADLGSIEPGKLADLVVIDGNPLTNIKDLRRMKLVVKDGRVFERDALLRR